MKWFYWLIIFILIVVIIVLLFTIQKIRKEHLNNELVRQIVLNSLQAFVPQMEIIFSLFVSLRDIKNVEEEGAISFQYDEMKDEIMKIRKAVKSINSYKNSLRTKNDRIVEVFTDLTLQLRQVNTSLYTSSVQIIGIMSQFSNAYINNKSLLNTSSLKMAEIIYYLSSIVPILSDFSGSSNEVSKEIIMSMIDKFNVISEFSSQITTDIKQTMADLMDENREDSLAHVVKKAQSLLSEFEMFFQDMQNLKTVSNNFVQKSVEKLKSIEDIAGSIEEIAETIKVISLNVSIEAANTGNVAKGFQVLARDLREFALKTMNFAHDVKARVKDAMQTTESLKEDYIDKMNSVYEYVSGIRISLESFGNIIKNSFSKIKDVIASLQDFSKRIENGIKEVVGQLQYYDVRSQEVEHISVFISGILEKFYMEMDSTRINVILTDEHKEQIRREILMDIDSMITTSNERTILRKYELAYGLIISDHTDMSKDDEDSIFVF